MHTQLHDIRGDAARFPTQSEASGGERMGQVFEVVRPQSGGAMSVEMLQKGGTDASEASLIVAAENEETLSVLVEVWGTGVDVAAVAVVMLDWLERLQNNVAIRATPRLRICFNT